MGLKKYLGIMTAVAMLGIVAGCGGSEQATKNSADKNIKIGVVQLVEHAALDAANKGFVDGLAEKGYKVGEKIELDQQNAQADQSNLQNIAHRFVGNKVNLICAIATPAAQTMANATKDIPIVGTAITDYEVAKLVKSNAQPGTNVTGTNDMNPIAAQVELMLKVAPNAKNIGVIYTSSEVNSQLQVDEVKKVAAAKGLTVHEATVSTVNDIQQAAQSLVGNIDALYVPTDNVMASAMPTLAIVTNEAKIPVVCGASTMVMDGGLATLGIDYYKLGVQTGHMAAKILKGEAKPADMAIESQKDFDVIINEKTVKALGMNLTKEMLK